MTKEKFEKDKYPSEVYDSFSKFKDLIKENHNIHTNPIKVKVELKSENDPLTKLVEKTGFTGEIHKEEWAPWNRLIFPIYYDMTTNKFKTAQKTLTNNKYIELDSEELNLIKNSALEVYKR